MSATKPFAPLPVFEVSDRPLFDRALDWLSELHTNGGKLAELAELLATALTREGELAATLAHLQTRIHLGQLLQLAPLEHNWSASYHYGRSDDVALYYSATITGALLGLSSLLEGHPELGARNPALDYGAIRSELERLNVVDTKGGHWSDEYLTHKVASWLVQAKLFPYPDNIRNGLKACGYTATPKT